MKEQVARILGNMAHEIEQCDCKDPAYGLEIKQATLQVCQKFPKTVKNPDGYEPELEPMEKLAIELKDCTYQGEPKFNNALEADAHNWDVRELSKPDEGRLLTDSEFLDWCGSHIVKGCQTTRMMIDEGEEIREVLKCEDCRAKAQDAKTASIKDAEIAKIQGKLEGRWKAMKHLLIRCQQKDAECQERVERIFKEIEKVYGKTFGRKQQFIGVIPSEDWQAIKKKELK